MRNELWLTISSILVFAGLVASQGLLLVVGSLAIIVSLAARIWEKFAFERVAHERGLSQRRAFIGDSIEYTVTLSNEKLLPLIWVDIQDTFPQGLDLPGAVLRGSNTDVTKQHTITTSLLPYQKASWKYSLRCNSRGYHRIGPARLRSGDIFGFSASETRMSEVDYLLVYPRIVDLGRLVFSEEHPLGDTKGINPLFQDTTRFVRQRDYQPTDPMKHIDWKATARKMRLQTKVFEPVVSLNVLIAMNATTSEHAWQGSNRRHFERAVTAAASVAHYAAERGYTFGLASNAVASYSGKWLTVPMGASSSQISLVLEALAMAGPYVVTPLVEVLREERRTLSPGATVMLVTAVITRALVEEIEQIKRSGHEVQILFAGDGAPGIQPPGVRTYRVGRVLEALDEHEPVPSH